MKKAKGGILIFCVVLMVLLVFLIPFNAKMAEPDSRFGVNAFILNRYNWEEWDIPISLLKELKVNWVREEFVWKQIEPERGKFDWVFYDKAFEKLKKSDINILGIIDYSAPWSTDDPNRVGADKYMPNISDWRNYVARLVDRYGSEVKYWQIWNEPNLSMFFRPEPNISKYLLLLKNASEVIREKDRDAKIVLGGLSGVDVGYLQELKNADAGRYFDILAVHPYRLNFKLPPETGGLMKDLESVDTIAREFGNKDIWLTEFGWPTDNIEGVSEEVQAEFLVRTYLMSFSFPNIKKLFWYDFRNDGHNKEYREDNFGLIDRDYKKKKSFLAYKNLINILEHSEFKKNNISNGVYDFFFDKNGGKIRVIWKVEGEEFLNIENDGRKDMVVYDYLGNVIYNKEVSPTMNIKISAAPVFIVSGSGSVEEDVDYGKTLEYEYISQSPYLTLKDDETQEIWLKIKNTGTYVWRNSGANPLMLGTCRDRDRASSFFIDGSWVGTNRPAKMQESVVKPGGIATFIFNVKSDQLSSGIYREYFCPLVEGINWMRDIGIYWEINVQKSNNLSLPEPIYNPGLTYHAVYVSQTNVESGRGGYSEQVELKIKNVGTATWYNYGSHPVRLGTSRPLDRNNSLIKAHSSSQPWISDNRPTTMVEREVRPGEIATFLFVITKPLQSGIYREYFCPVVEGIKWMEDFGLYWEVKVN